VPRPAREQARCALSGAIKIGGVYEALEDHFCDHSSSGGGIHAGRRNDSFLDQYRPDAFVLCARDNPCPLAGRDG
jgi:hypothetical protein